MTRAPTRVTINSAMNTMSRNLANEKLMDRTNERYTFTAIQPMKCLRDVIPGFPDNPLKNMSSGVSCAIRYAGSCLSTARSAPELATTPDFAHLWMCYQMRTRTIRHMRRSSTLHCEREPICGDWMRGKLGVWHPRWSTRFCMVHLCGRFRQPVAESSARIIGQSDPVSGWMSLAGS